MNIFLDSSFLIAYAIEIDAHYNRAIELDDEGIFINDCYISNLVINEVITVVGNKSSFDIAIQLFDVIKDNCTILNEFELSNFNNIVINEYSKHNGKLSFTDSSISVLMKNYNLQKIVSFNKDFDRIDHISRIY
ncbi:PIN domain-containing protein [Methanobrevibacter sp. DSM 116169]|uniref:PIN domain-containing protein n=1 Tax=Methanobrevibacter sp. DSM 116169 TaxID=3242727 RepID=UPI0038FD0248